MGKQSKKLYVVVSLDVEEEGLFGGQYPSRPTVRNVQALPLLKPLWDEFRLPLTLFCAHSVFMDKDAAKTLSFMTDNLHAEIGAHLHHWSTPPYIGETGQPTPSHLLPYPLFKQKLHNLLLAGRKFLGKPLASFRMGRWDLKSSLMPALAEAGIKVDSSVCPLRCFSNGPDHFLASPVPYWLDLPNGLELLEAPVTQIPLFAWLPNLWRKISGQNRDLLDKFHFFGALSCNPLWHGSLINRIAARLNFGRHNNILQLFWHSSEMVPGGSPHIRHKKDADKLLARIFDFFAWLASHYQVEGLTISQLATDAFNFEKQKGPGNWC